MALGARHALTPCRLSSCASLPYPPRCAVVMSLGDGMVGCRRNFCFARTNMWSVQEGAWYARVRVTEGISRHRAGRRRGPHCSAARIFQCLLWVSNLLFCFTISSAASSFSRDALGYLGTGSAFSGTTPLGGNAAATSTGFWVEEDEALTVRLDMSGGD
jgi:hypothetical protein